MGVFFDGGGRDCLLGGAGRCASGAGMPVDVELVAAVEQPAREMARATAATEREVRKERMVDS